jgi:putative transposase
MNGSSAKAVVCGCVSRMGKQHAKKLATQASVASAKLESLEGQTNLARDVSPGSRGSKRGVPEERPMSHSYSSNRVHLVFSTKNRVRAIGDGLQSKLWAYMAGIACNHRFEAVKVGGVEDHAHALLVVPPRMPLAKAIQTLKGCSSKWINESGRIKGFAWQEGYGAFSVSASQTDGVVAYIENQREHHAKKSFEDEFVSLLKRYGVHYDPKYVLG